MNRKFTQACTKEGRTRHHLKSMGGLVGARLAGELQEKMYWTKLRIWVESVDGRPKGKNLNIGQGKRGLAKSTSVPANTRRTRSNPG